MPSTFVENSPVHCTSVGKAILAYQEPRILDWIIAASLQRFTETTVTYSE